MITKRILASLILGIGLAGCSVSAEPLTEMELALNADDKLSRVVSDQEPVAQSISLYEAMARALKYNLDFQVEMYSKALESHKLRQARADMLPSLVTNAHKSNRDNDPFSFSVSQLGIPSTNASTSREPQSLTKDLTFSWHILDFGVSYVRAKQASDRVLIAEEQKRKVINRIIEDVRSAYWRAVSSERLMRGFQRLEGRVSKALGNSRALKRRGYTSPVAALTYQRELVDIKRQVQRYERELKTAKIQLAALMNLRPDDHYHLVVPKRRIKSIALEIPSNEMVRLALQNRPELRELAYNGRINEREAEVALLEMLPGIQLYAGANYDSNRYLLNNDWVTWGAKASWNVMKLFTYPVRKGVVNAEAELIDKQALAMTMAIMTQVEVARARYKYLRKSARTAAEYYHVQRQILKQIKASSQAHAASEQSLIREEMNTLVASVQYDIAYADLQNSFATIYASIGVDPHGDDLDMAMSINELAASLRKTWRERGDVSG